VTSREIEEYRALRTTISERSTARLTILLSGFGLWAALLLATYALTDLPVATLLPLLLLVLTFEIVFAIHSGVERIGRYIQVFFEDEEIDRGWEHQAMAFGQRYPSVGHDALFALYFWIGIALNLVPAVLAAPIPEEWLVVGTAHALACLRIAWARRGARAQRPLDLERFRSLKTEWTSPRP
jgi:hypothetical protein